MTLRSKSTLISASWNTFLSERGCDAKMAAPEPQSFPRINQSQFASHIPEASRQGLIVQSQVVFYRRFSGGEALRDETAKEAIFVTDITAQFYGREGDGKHNILVP